MVSLRLLTHNAIVSPTSPYRGPTSSRTSNSGTFLKQVTPARHNEGQQTVRSKGKILAFMLLIAKSRRDVCDGHKKLSTDQCIISRRNLGVASTSLEAK